MVSYSAWWCYLELLQEALGDFHERLFSVDREAAFAFDQGFDAMERLVRPEFFIEGPDYSPSEVAAALCGGLWPLFAGLGSCP